MSGLIQYDAYVNRITVEAGAGRWEGTREEFAMDFAREFPSLPGAQDKIERPPIYQRRFVANRCHEVFDGETAFPQPLDWPDAWDIFDRLYLALPLKEAREAEARFAAQPAAPTAAPAQAAASDLALACRAAAAGDTAKLIELADQLEGKTTTPLETRHESR